MCYISQLIRYARASSNYSDFLKMSKTLLRHTLIKKYFWHFSWLPYLYTFSLYENALFIIVSAETEYLNRNESGRFGALKSDSTNHFFRNACTKSGSLRFSQFSGCWLILSVYIIMSFEFSFKIFLTFFLASLSIYIFTIWKCIVYNRFCRDGIFEP
jgi:hypothetical protein